MRKTDKENLTQTSPASANRDAVVSFKTAFKFWIWLGFVSFGGPAGQIAVMHRELVERKRWINETAYLHALNFCMLLPGPEAQQLATYCGWRLHGTKGGIAAGAFFVLPAVFILLILSFVYARYGNLWWTNGILNGLKSIVLAIVFEAVYKIGRRALKKWWHWPVSGAAFIVVYFLHLPFPLIVLFAGLIGIFLAKITNQKSETKDQSFKTEFFRQSNKILKVILTCFGLWLIPLVLAYLCFGLKSLPIKIYLFFSGAAFVTFGGAYAVLAYVNQIAVNFFGWITAQQAIDGLALAETTPGPLIMVLEFVGFMAGWNNAPANLNQTFFAVTCALLTVFATFLPSFLFIFSLAPFVENLRENKILQSALESVTAAVVGVILTLAATFGATVIFSQNGIDWFAFILAMAALFILLLFKIEVLSLILVGGLLGLIKMWLTF